MSMQQSFLHPCLVVPSCTMVLSFFVRHTLLTTHLTNLFGHYSVVTRLHTTTMLPSTSHDHPRAPRSAMAKHRSNAESFELLPPAAFKLLLPADHTGSIPKVIAPPEVAEVTATQVEIGIAMGEIRRDQGRRSCRKPQQHRSYPQLHPLCGRSFN